ncbi:MAG: methylated-DNA--[protein]-cysteine S-methyltransferase [Verrucomicrobiaceae bacterium]|nr:MAG: methylated-DNA--[protein]-cysteine S-methyltransferase [Verrucomicrobiaceae bacterium]
MNDSGHLNPGPARGRPGFGRHARVILEAATPEESKARGRGMTVMAGVSLSPFGHCLVAESPRGICHLSFFDEGGENDAMAEIRAAWPLAELIRDDGQAAGLIDEIFTPAHSRSSPWKLFVRGTPFQLRVWRALLRVPAGALISYGALAAAVGNPRACRATGSAVGANPVACLIPCHRVIPQDGGIGHYRWGAGRKRAMLACENAPGHLHLPDGPGIPSIAGT